MMIGDLFSKRKVGNEGLFWPATFTRAGRIKFGMRTVCGRSCQGCSFLKERRFTMDVCISQARFTGQVWSLVRYFRNFAAIRMTLMG